MSSYESGQAFGNLLSGLFRLLTNKVVIVLVVILFVVFAAINMISGVVNKDKPKVTALTTTAPAISAAPYEVLTTSRLYYVKTYTDDGQVVTMEDWYSYDAKKWVRQTKPFELDRNVYGVVTIKKR